MIRSARFVLIFATAWVGSASFAQSAEDQFLDHVLQQASSDGSYEKADEAQKSAAKQRLKQALIARIPFFKAFEGASQNRPLKELIDPKAVSLVEFRRFFNFDFISVLVNGDTHILIDTKGLNKRQVKALKELVKAAPNNVGAMLISVLGEERIAIDKAQTLQSLKENKVQLWLRSTNNSGRIWDDRQITDEGVRTEAYRIFDQALGKL